MEETLTPVPEEVSPSLEQPVDFQPVVSIEPISLVNITVPPPTLIDTTLATGIHGIVASGQGSFNSLHESQIELDNSKRICIYIQ